ISSAVPPLPWIMISTLEASSRCFPAVINCFVCITNTFIASVQAKCFQFVNVALRIEPGVLNEYRVHSPVHLRQNQDCQWLSQTTHRRVHGNKGKRNSCGRFLE